MTQNLNSVISDQDVADLVERNTMRLNAAKEKLGTKYLIHPSNQITKKVYKKKYKQSSKNNCKSISY